MRVGGVQPISVDVRVIAATNQPLRELVDEGRFRADLFYRLNVLRIYLPPLRERPDDIPLLVRRFIQDYSQQHERPFHGISADAMQMLVDYPWPGNVRELRNLIESMVVLSPGHEIEPDDLPRQIREGGSARFLPVHVGPIVRGQDGAAGRELEFIVRSLIELKLQVEELRRRIDEDRPVISDGWIGEVHPAAPLGGFAVRCRRSNRAARRRRRTSSRSRRGRRWRTSSGRRSRRRSRRLAAIDGAPPTCSASGSARYIGRSKNTGCRSTFMHKIELA